MRFVRKLIIFCAAILLLSGCAHTEAKERFTEASDLLGQAEYDKAIGVFEGLIADNEYTAECWRGIGIARMETGAYTEASIAFSRSKLAMTNQGPAFARDLEEYTAYCRMKTGKTAEAEAIYDTLIAEEAEPNLLYMRGRLLMAEGRTEEALADFDQAASLTDDYRLVVSIYEVFRNYKMNTYGAEFLSRAHDMAEKNEREHYGRAVISYYLQNYDQAKEELLLALRNDADDEHAVLLLGRTYLAMDDPANARAMFREYLDNPRCAAASCNGLALCDMLDGSYDSALSHIREGLALQDEAVNESLLYNEIVVYEYKKEWETAKIKAAAFHTMFPDNEAGQREYEFLMTR